MLLAIVSVVGTVAVAYIARLPGMTAADRRRAALKANLELIQLLPKERQAELTEAAHEAVRELVEERRANRDWERLPLLALAIMIASIGMFVLADAAAGGIVDLAGTVAPLLFMIAVALVLVAVLFELAYVVVLATRGWRWIAGRLRARRSA